MLMNILVQQWDEGKIELLANFKILLLNRRNRVLGIVSISSGGLSSTAADPKVIFTSALNACARGIILCGNHAGGELNPGNEDLALTRRLLKAVKMLDLKYWIMLL